MERQISLRRLWAELYSELHWQCLHQPGEDHYLRGDPWAGDDVGGAALVGFFNFIRPHVVQIAGLCELAYLGAHPEAMEQFLPHKLRLLVICEDQVLDDHLYEALKVRQIAVMTTPIGAQMVLARVQRHLHQELAPRQQVHGVLVDVLGVGLLLQGEVGIGKSELALELVSRGHRLVADDSVLCIREAPNILTGHCPAPLRNFLEVRGLGIINIREFFGAAAIVHSKRIRLVVEIQDMRDMEIADIDRLQGKVDHLDILGTPLPRLCLPASAARNLAVLVEAAARSQYVKESGGDMLADFEAQVRLSVGEE
ncbi:HPr(Ser) kinase/phosphatase [Acidithiobacillus ferrivorans]|uniref:HPr(Ser) kinase/phosphatase n=1 Tax=Acidithiobacillus ferrivorans TaxID=160808 RepID=A0A7T4WDC8_9PROT|nr:HPr(Ser) kinase/phosphatase [Acidithiobacillus ferrivorans]QQD72568.1 HPr(Ser) kinase/phosphatase [Acidithiobacillus ferrivorans]